MEHSSARTKAWGIEIRDQRRVHMFLRHLPHQAQLSHGSERLDANKH